MYVCLDQSQAGWGREKLFMLRAETGARLPDRSSALSSKALRVSPEVPSGPGAPTNLKSPWAPLYYGVVATGRQDRLGMQMAHRVSRSQIHIQQGGK